MKKIIVLLSMIFILQSCSNVCETEICLKEKIATTKAMQEQQEKDRIYELEKMKIQAEIEKNKPVEVKVQELKNSETSMGEGVVTAVGIAGATYVGGKLLDAMFDF